MKIQLDHVQRLNLHAVLGAQRGDVATIRALWALQDKIALSPEEEKTIELRRECVAGQERIIWNPMLALQAKEFEFAESEAVRVRSALESWNSFGADVDRRWLQPLLWMLWEAPSWP